MTAVVAARVLGVEMHDEQIAAAVGLAEGRVVEMQTGEEDTRGRAGGGLARPRAPGACSRRTTTSRRDAEWMRELYGRMGVTVAFLQQGMSADERRAAYLADVTYATANEVGFDYLRDGLAYDAIEAVQRPLGASAAVIDEADSILIDEARIPLVIAGGEAGRSDLPVAADRVVRELLPGHHFTREPAGRNVQLTAEGVRHVEHSFDVPNLFDDAHLDAHTAVQDALHAHVLLRKEVDYIVHGGAVLSVDEFKGRVVAERRWPAGLRTALECKERAAAGAGTRAGSITVQHLVAMCGHVSGMTGTAASQADRLHEIYGLDVISSRRTVPSSDRSSG